MIDILIALFLGIWFGISFDLWTLDATYGDTESVGHYLAEPWQTLKRFWGILSNEPTE